MSNSLFSPTLQGLHRNGIYNSPTPVDVNCTEGIQWIWVLLQQCAVTPREITAVSMGMISTVIWLVFVIPQIWENFRKGIPDQAISPLLLGSFFIGDLLNLSGCILTHQLLLQTIIAIDSVICDIIQITQFIYYKVRHRRLLQAYGDPITVPPDTDEERVLDPPSSFLRSSSPLLCCVSLLCLPPLLITYYSSPSTHTNPPSSIVMRILLSFSSSNLSTLPPQPVDPPFFPTSAAYVGYVLGWCSAITFSFSRIPQIIKNWKRSSTVGLSVITFSLSILGNTTYGLQIFLTSCDSLYLLRSLPWIFGFPGVIILDCILCAQFYYYRQKVYTPLTTDFGENEILSTPYESSISI